MVQTESTTVEGYNEAAKLLAGEAATEWQSVCCLKTTCTADDTQTSAGVTKATESGFTLVDADSVKTVKTTGNNDTIQLDHKFTAGADATILGAGCWNNDDDVLYALTCFAAALSMSGTNKDTLTYQMKCQVKKGS
jgi:hypothetical protein